MTEYRRPGEGDDESTLPLYLRLKSPELYAYPKLFKFKIRGD
jgi:hypothetical protein